MKFENVAYKMHNTFIKGVYKHSNIFHERMYYAELFGKFPSNFQTISILILSAYILRVFNAIVWTGKTERKTGDGKERKSIVPEALPRERHPLRDVRICWLKPVATLSRPVALFLRQRLARRRWRQATGRVSRPKGEKEPVDARRNTGHDTFQLLNSR